jgi:predicted AAA+ superfamily ATPase
MFFRQIEVELEKWAAKPGRKPLILRGARQVGKTTVVHKFGEKFDNYLYVNLVK